jgi:hypothetical protein
MNAAAEDLEGNPTSLRSSGMQEPGWRVAPPATAVVRAASPSCHNTGEPQEFTPLGVTWGMLFVPTLGRRQSGVAPRRGSLPAPSRLKSELYWPKTRTMWHFLTLAMAGACVAASAAEAAPKKKGLPLDPFRACDLQVRADLREGGTWLIPRDIRLDEGRLILTLTFSTEKSIRSVPKTLYGNTDEEKGACCAVTSKK